MLLSSTAAAAGRRPGAADPLAAAAEDTVGRGGGAGKGRGQAPLQSNALPALHAPMKRHIPRMEGQMPDWLFLTVKGL